MLKEIDLKLFEILDSEIDKTLSEWCYINDESWLFKIWDNAYVKISSENKFTYITLLTGDVPKVKYLEIQNPNNYFENINNPTFDILWHYPTTNTILRYCHQKNILLNNHKDYNVLCIYNIDWYYFDTTKEIIDFTDEQKQELYDFLKTII